MMSRIWDEPYNTLRKGAVHVRERIVIPQLLVPAISADPTFLGLIDYESDMTVPLITRYFMNATDWPDITDPIQALLEISVPTHPRLRAHRKVYPVPPTFLSRMLLGAPTFDKFLTKCAAHLANIDLEKAVPLVNLIVELYGLIKLQGPQYLSQFRLCSRLWTNLFLHLRKAAKVSDSPRPSYANVLFLGIIKITADCFHDCQLGAPGELELFLALCIRTDMFGALDLALPVCISQKSLPGECATARADIK